MAPDGITVLGTVSKSDLTDEGAGLFTFTNNDGSDVQFDVRSVEVVFDAASNSYNFLDAAGAVIASIDMNASNVAFDNTTSGLAATDVQTALDELANLANNLTDELIDNGDGTYTHIAVDDTPITFDTNRVNVTVSGGVYTFLDGQGNPITSIDTNANALPYDNTTSGLTATDVQTALDELATQIGDLDLIDNLDGTFSLMGPDGTTILGTVSKSDLTDEGAGLFTFTNNDGSDVQFDVRSVEVVFDAASNSYNFLDAAGAVIASIDMNASNVAFDNTTSGLAATDVQTALDELANLANNLTDELIDNGDGTYTHIAVDNTPITFDTNRVNVTVSGGVYTFLDGQGNPITSIDTNANALPYDNTTSGLTATDVQTALDELATQIGDLDLIDNLDGTFSLMAPDGITVLGTVSKSDLTDEGDGLFTFTNNDGSDVQFDVRSVEVVFDAASNVYNFLDAAGAVIASIDMNASNVAFDNTTSGLTATTVQAAIDEIAAVAGGLSDALVDNGDGTYTHTTVSGDVIIIDANTVSVTVAGGVYTFVDGVGNTITTIDTNAAAIAYDNTASGLAATNVQAALDELATQIGDLDLIDNLDGTFSLMAPDGITVLGTVSKSDLTDEGDGLYTFTNNDGSDVQFDVRSVEVVFDAATNVYNFLDSTGAVIASIDMNADNVAYNNATSGLTATDVQAAIDELATLANNLTDELIDNSDGTYTHIAVDGASVSFDTSRVNVVFANGVYTFVDSEGIAITSIDTNANVLPYDNTASGLTAADVQAAIDELATQIGDLDLVDNADGTFSLMGPDGTTILGTVSKSDLTDEGDGLYTFTNNDGSDVQFDVRSVEVVFDAATNVYNFLDSTGAVIASIDMNADNVAYDNTASGLTATDVQAAIDELSGQIGDLDLVDNADGTFSLMAPDGITVLGTVSKSDLTDEGDGLFTFTNNDGSDVQFDVRSVEVVFDAASNSYNFLDNTGAVIASIDMNASNVAYDNATSGLTATNVQAAIDEIVGLTGGLSDALVDNGDE